MFPGAGRINNCPVSQQSAAATRLNLLYILTRSNRCRLACTGCGRGRTHSVLNLLRHGQEGLFDVCRILRGGLKEGDGKLIGKFLCDAIFHDFLAGKIGLVANKQLVHTLRSIAVDFLQPLLHVGECVVVSDIIDNNNAVCSTVVRRGDGTETFLSCGIPNLKLDSLAFELNSTNLEVNANCRYVAFCIGIVCETEEKAGLSDAGVTDEKEFEEVVVLAGVHVGDG